MWKSNGHLAFVFIYLPPFISAIIENQILGMLHFSLMFSCRLGNIIMEAIKKLNDPMGSNVTAIANYIGVCILLLFSFLAGTRVICFMVCDMTVNEHPYCCVFLKDNVELCC